MVTPSISKLDMLTIIQIFLFPIASTCTIKTEGVEVFQEVVEEVNFLSVPSIFSATLFKSKPCCLPLYVPFLPFFLFYLKNSCFPFIPSLENLTIRLGYLFRDCLLCHYNIIPTLEKDVGTSWRRLLYFSTTSQIHLKWKIQRSHSGTSARRNKGTL